MVSSVRSIFARSITESTSLALLGVGRARPHFETTNDVQIATTEHSIEHKPDRRLCSEVLEGWLAMAKNCDDSSRFQLCDIRSRSLAGDRTNE